MVSKVGGTQGGRGTKEALTILLAKLLTVCRKAYNGRNIT